MRVLWLLLICIAASCLAVSPVHYRRLYSRSTTDNKCASHCSGFHGDVRYEPGKKYTYNVNSKTVLKVANKDTETVVNQNAKAHISVHSACEFSLTLSDVSLHGMNVENDWKQTLEKHSLRFGFDDGKIVAVCPSNKDPVWAVNAKRAILSAFQSLRAEVEVDVVGECPTERAATKSGSHLTIKTTKNIAACNRAHDISGFRSVPYKLYSNVQTAPVFESKQSCNRTIENNILKQTKCTEVHKTASLFTKDETVAANIEQTFDLVTTSAASSESPFNFKSTIMYDHSEDADIPKANLASARVHIDLLCKGEERASEKSASSFTEVVFILRTLSADEIRTIANDQCGAFADALSTCATVDCIQYLTGLVNSGLVSDKIFQSFALMPNPDHDTIKKITNFINKAPETAYLSLSSLVQSYCLRYPECSSNSDVQKIVKILTSKLPNGCNVRGSFEEVKKVVGILKAIGNIGFEKDSISMINQCIDNTNNALGVRIAAIDALRRKPCSDERNKRILQRYLDIKENVELRLTAFRQLMLCEDEAIIQKVLNSLNTEPLNQVGSYVTSYLSAKQSSKNPSSKNLQKLLRRHHVTDRFDDLDSFRFSKFRELGYFDPESNYGGHIDTSVIFDPKGYIPREASVNLTLHLFGRSYNIFEIGGRAEGLETIHEEAFGPDGAVLNPVAHTLREKKYRFHNEKANQLRELFFRQAHQKEGSITASYYLRMFGDDVAYDGFQKDDVLSNIDEWTSINYYMQKWKKETKTKMSRNILLAALTQTLPTLSGLPLQLSLNASVSSTYEQKARFNIDAMFARDNQFAEIMYETRPSMSANVGASIVLKADKVASGVRGTFTLFASRSFGIKIGSKDNKSFSIRIVVPDDDVVRSEIKTRAEKIESNSVSPMRNQKGTSNKFCTSQVFSKTFGLKGCIEMKNKAPEIDAGLVLQKTDPKLTAYEIKYETSSSSDVHGFKLTMDTPGSKTNRKMEASFELSTVRRKLLMGFQTPFKLITVDGDLIERVPNQDYDAKLKIINDGTQTNLDGKIKKTLVGTNVKYTIDGKADDKDKSGAELRTTLEYNTAKPYYDFDFHLDKLFKKPVVMKGILDVKDKTFKTKLFHSSEEFESHLEGSLAIHGKTDFKGHLEGYSQLKNDRKHSFAVSAEQSLKYDRLTHQLMQAVAFEASSYRKLGYKLSSNRNPDFTKNKLEVTCGKEVANFIFDATRKADAAVEFLAQATSTTGLLNHKATGVIKEKIPQEFLLKVEAETPKTKNLRLHLEYVTKVNPVFNLHAKAELHSPIRNILFTQNLDNTAVGKYKGKTHVEWGPSPKERADADSEITFIREHPEYGFVTTIDLHDGKGPLTIRKMLRKDEKTYRLDWNAARGKNILYELSADLLEESRTALKLHATGKYAIFTPKETLEVFEIIANKNHRNHQVLFDAVVKKHGSEVAAGKLALPESKDVQEKDFKLDVSWKEKAQMRTAAAEFYTMGLHKRSMHRLHLEHDNKNKFDAELDHRNKVTFKCGYEADSLKMLQAQVQSTRLDVRDMEVDGDFTVRPGRGREDNIKLKLASKFKDNEAKLDTMFEHNGYRNLMELLWNKQDRQTDKEYLWGLKLDTPKGGIRSKQKFNLDKRHIGGRALTEFEATKHDGIKYQLDSDITFEEQGIKSETRISAPKFNGKHFFELAVAVANAKLVHNVDANGKQYNTRFEVKSGRNSTKFDMAISTPSEKLKKAEFLLSVAEDKIDLNGNVNDVVLGKLGFHITAKSIDCSYILKVLEAVDGEGKLVLRTVGNEYDGELMARNFNRKFNMDIHFDGRTGTAVITYAGKELLRKKFIAKVMNDHEVHLVSESGGSPGNLDLHIHKQPNHRSLKLTVVDIEKPFEIILDNKNFDIKMEVALDPRGAKKTYGFGSIYEAGTQHFKKWNLILRHPLRTLQLNATKHSDVKYSLSLQQEMKSRRRPTVLELTSEKQSHGYMLKSSLSDDSLKNPVKAVIGYEAKMSSEFDYELELKSQLDYSGQPSKIINRVLHIKRKPIGGVNDGGHFEVEMKVSQSSSNFQTRVWLIAERKKVDNHLIPVHGNLGFEHRDSKVNSMEYSVSFDTNGKTFAEYKLSSPSTKLKARTDRITDKHYKIGFYRNSDKPSVVGELKLLSKRADLEIRDEKSGDVKLHATAGMLNDNHAELECWHSSAGKKMKDSKISVLLTPNSLLKIDIFVRPTLENDAVKTVNMAASAADDFERVSTSKMLTHAMIESCKKITEDIFAEVIDPLFRSWTKDEFDFAKQVGINYQKTPSEVEAAYSRFKTGVLGKHDCIQKEIDDFLSSIPKMHYMQQLRKLKPSGRSHTFIKDALKPIGEFNQYLSDESKKLQKRLAYIIEYADRELHLKAVRGALDEFKKKLMEADFIEVLLRKARLAAKKYSLPKEVFDVLNKVEADKTEYKSKLINFYEKLREEIIEDLSTSTLAKLLKSLLDIIAPEEVDQVQIKRFLQTLVDFGRGTITSDALAEKLWKKYIPVVQAKGPGETEITVTVPRSVDSLNDIANIIDFEHYTAMLSRSKALLSPVEKDLMDALKDTIYTFKTLPGRFYSGWPPLKSVGYLVGSNGFITFDGRSLPFQAGCRYLLAADFIHKTFLLIGKINPHTDPKNPDMELTMEYRGQVLHFIKNRQHPKGKLIVDGKAEPHLPYQNIDQNDGVALITVLSTSNGIKVETYDGISILCNGRRNYCQVVLPGLMHGKSAGLLGSNDNEPSNDRDLVDGTSNVNTNVMAEHWAVEGICKENLIRIDGKKDEECTHLFVNSDSPLEDCFSTIRPLPFEKLCLTGKDLFGVVTAYHRACITADVEITLPDNFVGLCELPTAKHLKVGEEEVVHGIHTPTLSHFIFVVEEQECMEKLREKIAKLAQKLQEKNKDAKFTWVGYGGDGALNYPHIHYVDGSIVYSANDIKNIAAKPFENPSGLRPPEYSSAEAVLFAAKSFISVGSPNHQIVLIACKKCADDISASELREPLLNMGYKFNVLTASKMKTSAPGRIVGADAEYLYNENGAAIPNNNLYTSTDICSKVARETGGVVFGLNRGYAVAAGKMKPRLSEAQNMRYKCEIDEDMVRLTSQLENKDPILQIA